MKNRKILWLILGIVAAAAGIMLLERYPLGGLLLFLGGVASLLLTAIGFMRDSGSVKENFFHSGSSAAQKFDSPYPAPENQNVWEQLTGKQEEQK